jgi:TRAP transporter TAXI family solute receptor
MAYSDGDGGWIPAVMPGPVESRVEGPPGILTGAERLLATLGDTLRAAPAHTSPTGSRIIEEELEGAKQHIDARLARLAAGYPLAAGPPGGAYERLAKTLSADAAAQDVTLAVLQTAGSVDNIGLLRTGTAELAFVQADVAALASAGKGVFASAGPYDTLRALLALFPEQVHIVVRADDKARKISDLNGRRAALGLTNSGTRVTATSILGAAGVQVVEPQGIDTLDPRGALAALAEGRVDVAFVVGLAPFPPVVEAFSAAPLRLLPIAESFADVIRKAGLIPLQIPAYAYSGQRETVPVAAVAALLVVDARLTDAEAKRIGEAVLGRIGASERDPLSLMVGPGTTGLGIAVPLHPGAGRFADIKLH